MRWSTRSIVLVGLISAAIACRRRPPEGREVLHDGPPKDRPPHGPRAPDPRKPPPASPVEGPSESIHLALGAPRATSPIDDHRSLRPQYALSYNKRRNLANWVSWHLDAHDFGKVGRHGGKFLPDESLPAGFYRVRHEDYSGSGYDRGHLVRSEERTRSPEDNLATFVLSNVVPQRHEMNAGPWLRLEEHVQHLAQKEKKQLFLVAGPLFGKSEKTIGHGVAVPSSCFKIVVVLPTGAAVAEVNAATEVIAVDVPNEGTSASEGWERHRTSIDAIEAASGWDFLTAVPEEVQAVLERRTQ